MKEEELGGEVGPREAGVVRGIEEEEEETGFMRGEKSGEAGVVRGEKAIRIGEESGKEHRAEREETFGGEG